MKLSGYTMVRNGIVLDLCFKECILSMLPVCDEVVVSDSDSMDGTRQELDKLAAEHPKIKIINKPFDDPYKDPKWWVKWINWTREHLSHPMQLELDADEVLTDDPTALEDIRTMADKAVCARVDRLNFVKDAHHLIPDGHCCGKYVVRMGQSNLFMPSDEPYQKHELPEIIKRSVRVPSVKIFHYGFIRHMQAFFNKVRINNMIWWGRVDNRTDEYEAEQKENWYEAFEWGTHLREYAGGHPKVALEWLKERNRIKR